MATIFTDILSLLRKILLILCGGIFYLTLFFFHNFFLIESYNFISFVLMAFLILSNNYITCFFEKASIWDDYVGRCPKLFAK